MKSIIRGRGPHRLLGLAVVALLLGVVAVGETLQVPEATAQAQMITFQKVIVGQNGQPVEPQPDRSGYRFTLRLGTQEVTSGPTDAQGRVQLQPTITSGTFTVVEVPPTGVSFLGTRYFVNGIEQNFIQFPLAGPTNVEVRNQVAGTGQINIVKQILDANNNVVASQAAAGVSFTVTGPNGFSQTVATTATGQGTGTATLFNLATGTYTVTETVPAGFAIVSASVDGALSTNTPTFQVNAGQTRNVLFNNRAASTTTLTITKQIVDANNNVVAGANRSGFTFTVTCGTTTLTGTTDATGTATIANVPGGTCSVNETVPSGFTFVSGQVGTTTPVTTNPGSYTVTAGQPLAINVINRQAATTDAVPLTPGCNNVASTWAAGTPVRTISDSVTPPGSVEAIWRFEPGMGGWLAFSPLPNAPNNYTVTFAPLEAIFICVRQASTLNRPAR